MCSSDLWAPAFAGVTKLVIAAALLFMLATAALAWLCCQAVAALAYGVEGIEPVDMIVGPGNVYVAIAKRDLATRVTDTAIRSGTVGLCRPRSNPTTFPSRTWSVVATATSDTSRSTRCPTAALRSGCSAR